MEALFDLFKKDHVNQLVLAVLLALFIVTGWRMPHFLSDWIDSPLGKVAVVVGAFGLLVHAHPVLGILGMIAAYELIRRASDTTGMAALEQYYPTEEKKWSRFTPRHQFPYTLEQEMVYQMASQRFNDEYVKAPFRPVLDYVHDAAPVSSV